MIVLSGADVVLPDRVLRPGTVTIDDGRIVEVRAGAVAGSSPGGGFAFHGHYIVPGFIDVHVHGIDGLDTLDAADGVAAIAARMPERGVTAFCPTTMACSPGALRQVLTQVRRAREAGVGRAARVLPAHLESNFISPAYRGAQPAACLRGAAEALRDWRPAAGSDGDRAAPAREDAAFEGREILAEIERAVPDVGIVTLAPEIDGALDLVAWIARQGPRVSLGHSAASYEIASAAIAAGASHATHLFNRMPPLLPREPGIAGAVIRAGEVTAEIICDGFHVHPALVGAAVAAKGTAAVMAITDGTAAAGLPVGGTAALGGQPITAKAEAAFLADGTIAGGVATMDRIFRTLVGPIGLSLIDAAVMCATTPARALGLVGYGVIAVDAAADLVVLDSELRVVQTYVGGQLVYARSGVS